jgi:hypothetical protein
MNRELNFWHRLPTSGLVDRIEHAHHKLHRLVRTHPPVIVHPYDDWLDPDVPVQWLDDLVSSLRRHQRHQFLLVTRRPVFWQQRMNALSHFGGRAADFARLWLDGHVPHNLILVAPDDADPCQHKVIHAIPCRSTHPPTTKSAPTTA